MRSVDSLPPAAVALASLFEWLDPALKREQGWKLDGACLLEPTDLFFVDVGESAQPAKIICSTCPVKVPCLRYAIENREWDGIWGGTNEKERRPLIKAYEAGTPVEQLVIPLPNHGCGCGECRQMGQRRREREALSVPTAEKAPPGAKCPTCGLDVAGFAIGRTKDGRTTWDRPFAYHIGPTGTRFASGGLSHVEGGERCQP